ncbi:MAG: aldo/keto reductase [Bacteroidetes bacterium]|nr:aldo/keto reductase [Bacteroidota bacterium]
MKKINLPNSDVKITPITFGAWAIGGWFWGGTDEKESIQAIETAIDLGMTTIDTAPAYGFGQSEEFIGKAIKGKRNRVEILTKFGLRWDIASDNMHFKDTTDNSGNKISIYRLGRKESVIQECENCLKRLGTDYIDLFQQHWPDNKTPIDDTMEALDILKTQGKIRAGGVSNYSAEQISEADKTFNLSSNQVPYSMILRDIEKELVPHSIKNNKAIIVYSPLQRGILTGKITSDYKFGEGDHRSTIPFYKEPKLSQINQFLQEIKPIADSKNATLAQLVINWTMNQPGISCVLVGARNAKQVKENIQASEVIITTEEMQEINLKLNKLLRNL